MAKPQNPAQVPVEPIRAVDGAPERNVYYDKVAAGYRTAQYLTCFLLVVVSLAGLMTGSESVTYANFVYLLRDFDTVLSASGGEAAPTIRYSADDDRQYLLYRGNLALVDRSGVEVYNSAGRRTLADDPAFSDPRAAASEQYMLVYDLGGKSYALYNSLARIYTGTLDFPISGGAVSDSGMYAVVTGTREYTSAVLLYSRNNKLKNRFLKDKYVIDVAISDDGDRVAIVSAESVDGAYCAEFQVSVPGRDTALATLNMPGVFPLAVRFFDNNCFAVLCDHAIYFYSADGEEKGSYRFVDEAPSRFVLDGETAVLVFPNNVMGTESRVLCFDCTGTQVDEAVFEGRPEQAVLSSDALYLLTEHRLHRLSLSHGDTAGIDYAGGGKALLAVDDGVLLCTASAAYRYPVGQFSAQAEQEGDHD